MMENKITAKNGKIFGFRILTTTDRSEALGILLKYFVTGEVLNKASGKSELLADFVSDYVDSYLGQNISVGVYENDTNHLIAVMILYISTLESKPITAKGPLAVQRILSKMADYIPHTIIGDSKFMNIEMTSIQPEFGRLGIMGSLSKRVVEMAKQHGCKYLVALSTSQFIQNINDKLGFITLKAIRYDEYVDDVTGKREFLNVEPPHKEIKLMCLAL